VKLTVITAARTPCDSLEECISSVRSQTLRPVQHILVAAVDAPGLKGVMEKHGDWLSEVVTGADQGLYDALNRGIDLAVGDAICFLNSDDVYAHVKALERAAAALARAGTDSVYADLVYVLPRRTGQVVRYWRSGEYRPGAFRGGWMPPHPTFLARKSVYDKCGKYDTRFRISADYELLLRFFEKHRISTCYLPEVMVRMRIGGISNKSPQAIARKTFEDWCAWRANGLRGGTRAVALKNLTKLPQFLVRPDMPAQMVEHVRPDKPVRPDEPGP